MVTQLMKTPQFEDPINTVKDLVDQNITIFEYRHKFDDSRSFYLRENTSDWNHVANTMLPVGSYWCCCCNPDDFITSWQYYIKFHVHGNKTHAFLKGFLDEDDFEVKPVKGYNSFILNKKSWWRSDKIEIGTNRYNADLSSRNWILNEVSLLSLSLLIC